VKFAHVMFEKCEQKDKQTDRHADRNALHPSHGRSKVVWRKCCCAIRGDVSLGV